MRFVRWVRREPFAPLEVQSPAPSDLDAAAQYLWSQGGTLSVYRYDDRSALELVAIARSLGCASEASFTFLEIFDSDLVAANLAEPKHTPDQSTLSLEEAKRLHYTLTLVDPPRAAVLLRAIHVRRFTSGSGGSQTVFLESIAKSALKKLARTDPRFQGLIPSSHWLAPKNP